MDETETQLDNSERAAKQEYLKVKKDFEEAEENGTLGEAVEAAKRELEAAEKKLEAAKELEAAEQKLEAEKKLEAAEKKLEAAKKESELGQELETAASILKKAQAALRSYRSQLTMNRYRQTIG